MALIALVVAGCSKKDLTTTASVTTPPTSTDLLLDSIFLYAKQTYLWYNQLPDSATFKPRRFNTSTGTDIDKGTSEIFALTRYAINPSTGKSYEYYDNDGDTTDTKYSYMEAHNADLNQDASNTKSYVTLAGWGNDLGFYGPVFVADSIFCFSMIYENSPAYNAGLKRGSCYVTKVNGKGFSYNSSSDISTLNTALNASSITLTYLDSSFKSHDVQLTQTRYQSNPILKDSVWTVKGKKIGYIFLLSFASQDILYSKLKNTIANFKSEGISDVVVDLRYNGGGYVASSEQFANLLAPSSLNGQKMFSERYNDLMQNGNATILKYQYNDDGISYDKFTWKESALTTNFSDTANGGLLLGNVCFIVSDRTASASELLINNLKPYMNVKLIGATLSSASNKPQATNTYGKPVGFFALHISDYDVYLSQFESRNSQSTATPYSGFTCDITDWDDFTHDFGDTKEDAIAQAINYITNGTFLSTSTYIGDKASIGTSNSLVFKSILSSKIYQFKNSQSGLSSPFKKFRLNNTGTLPSAKGMIESPRIRIK